MEVNENEMKKNQEQKEKRKRKRYIILLLLILLLMGVSAGYAVLTTSLNINGVSRIKHVTIWDMHFENLEIASGSVEASTAPTIDSTKTIINYAVDLSNPGDFYEFEVNVKNSGSIDAKLDELPILSGVSEEQEEYVNYTVSHADDSPIIIGEIIEAGQATRFKVRIEIIKNTPLEKLPTENQVLNLSVDIPYVQA